MWEEPSSPGPMLSSGSRPVLALWGTNSKLPGPSGPLYPANRFLTHGHFSVIFCHLKSLLKYVPRIPAGEGRVGFPPNGCVPRRPLRADGKRSCPSRHPRSRTDRQVALPGPRQVRGARKVREWESHGPSAEGPRIQSLTAIPGLAGSTQGARPHNRAASPARRARCAGPPGRVRPSSPSPWTNPRPREAAALRTSGPQLPIGDGAVPAIQRGPGVGRAVSPAPRKETGAPTHRGASLALPRVPMAAAALPEPPHPARPDWLGGARRIAAVTAAAAACQAPPPRVFSSGPPTRRSPSWASPTAAHRSTNFV